ncbi:hypothetical protein N780_15685 [Pontibacillus chungwhensis BH030062]|uniref:Uncharacterized protein n=1 Tax=Pontibacillus chungwhensis BH030062 TaxID=1385513 RepID=A0A0A2UUM0_9BACI|nr:hypothetical protein [Pontibacillus chungwhensis]KGP91992.1 hypothetical protein N780_15685 [Pontibacillus chungwhensis BH030062]
MASKFSVGDTIIKRCASCLHDKQTVLKVDPNEFTDKVATRLWVQCSKCGTNDNKLMLEE